MDDTRFAIVKLDLIATRLDELCKNLKITIKGMSGEKLIITDQETGEEYVVKELGYPF